MHPDAERISSYLDGELGPAERAAVEKLLVEDSAARELFAELRQLQSGLRGLPQHKLPQGFADEVMRAAERLMLLGPEEPEPIPVAAEATVSTAPAPRAAVRNLWSSPAWFVAGAAAAVLLMFALGPWRGGDGANVVNAPTIAESSQENAVPPEDVSRAPERTLVVEATPGVGDSNVIPVPEMERPSSASTDDAPRVAVEATPDGPDTNDGAREPVAEQEQPAVAARRQPPFGMVVWVDVDPKLISGGEFDRLLGATGILVSNKVDQAAIDRSEPDVIYAEASMVELSNVIMVLFERRSEFRAFLMQESMGVFRNPEEWSKVLGSVNPDADGSRAVHITPEVTPARPLGLDEVNVQTLKNHDIVVDGAPSPAEAAPGKAVVDNGLVRAVFVLRPVPLEDEAPEPVKDDAPAATP